MRQLLRQLLFQVCHAWNVIRFEGADWHPVDSCWAAGSLDHNFKFTFKYNNGWWASPPEHFLYSHYPEQVQGHACCQVPALEQWAKWPNLKPCFFESGIALVSHNKSVIKAKAGEVLLRGVGADLIDRCAGCRWSRSHWRRRWTGGSICW